MAQLQKAIAFQATMLDHDAEVDATLVLLAPARPLDERPCIGGRGGLIAVDASGNLSPVFNTDGTYRGFARGAQTLQTAILR